ELRFLPSERPLGWIIAAENSAIDLDVTTTAALVLYMKDLVRQASVDPGFSGDVEFSDQAEELIENLEQVLDQIDLSEVNVGALDEEKVEHAVQFFLGSRRREVSQANDQGSETA